MKEKTAKEFALEQIAPYYANPSICGINSNTKNCANITEDGKMCVVGKNLLPDIRNRHPHRSFPALCKLYKGDQSLLLNPESVGILTNDQWSFLQAIHDRLTRTTLDDNLTDVVNDLGLFTVDELKEAAKSYKSPN
jgi:hypothetical protein